MLVIHVVQVSHDCYQEGSCFVIYYYLINTNLFLNGLYPIVSVTKVPSFYCILQHHCIVKFLLKEIIIFLLCYCFVLFSKGMEILFSFLCKRLCHYKRCGHVVFSNFRSLDFAHSLSHLFFIRIRYSNNLISSWDLTLTYLMAVLGHLILQFWLRLR